MRASIAVFAAWDGLIFGVVGALLATTSRASIRQGLWITLGLFWLASPWYVIWYVGDYPWTMFMPVAMNAALGTMPLLVCYLAVVWAGKRLKSWWRRPAPPAPTTAP